MLIVLHYNQNGVDAWANASTDNPANRFYLEIIEVGPPPFSLTLKAPASIPEKINPRKEGANQDEIVANGSMERDCHLEGLSKVQGHTDNVGGDDYNQKLSDARPTRS
jgi:hypothetical protein